MKKAKKNLSITNSNSYYMLKSNETTDLKSLITNILKQK